MDFAAAPTESSDPMTIRDWPSEERPREKLLARGPGALSDAELLAVFLGSGRRGASAVDLGRDLLTRAGSLKALLDASHGKSGIGPVAWCRLCAGLELGKRYLDEILSKGGSRPALDNFKAFRGREPSPDALLRHNGMIAA